MIGTMRMKKSSPRLTIPKRRNSIVVRSEGFKTMYGNPANMGRMALYRQRKSIISSKRPIVLPKSTDVARARASASMIPRKERTNQ